ncbi:MAG: lysozyme inhibitor LprI family protein [Fimbriimonadales bacterium]
MRIAIVLFALGMWPGLSAWPDSTIVQTQIELTEQTAREFVAADKVLNQTYKQLVRTLDSKAFVKLRKSQRLWVQFRDAEAEFEMDVYRGGSMASMVYHQSRTEASKTRVKKLEKMLRFFE